MSHFGNISFQFIIHLLIVIVKVQFLNHTTNIKSHINAKKKEKFKPSKVRRALKLEVRILSESLLQDDWPMQTLSFFKQKYQQLLEKGKNLSPCSFSRPGIIHSSLGHPGVTGENSSVGSGDQVCVSGVCSSVGTFSDFSNSFTCV